MGQAITVTAEDAHELSAYRADPADAPRGGLVVIQEIFGVNAHIRNVCDRFAEAGYTAIAPAMFDRVERGIELDYDADGVAKGREIMGGLDWDGAIRDVAAAAAAVADAGKTGAIGYCWGGSVAWLAATRLGLPSVGYYGGRIVELTDETPQAPVMLHFGAEDPVIPPEDIEKIRAARPDVPVFMYQAGHGFNCDARASYNEESAKFALVRTLEFLTENLG